VGEEIFKIVSATEKHAFERRRAHGIQFINLIFFVTDYWICHRLIHIVCNRLCRRKHKLNKYIMISELNFLSLRPCKARNEIRRYWLIFLSLFMFASTAWAQERVVSGSVVSEAGNPLVGVSVQVKGTTTSASAD